MTFFFQMGVPPKHQVVTRIPMPLHFVANQLIQLWVGFPPTCMQHFDPNDDFFFFSIEKSYFKNKAAAVLNL